MGWTYGWNSPREIREYLNKTRSASLTLVAQKATKYGRHLWSLYEKKDGERFIVLDLINGSPKSDWGYKDIDETMGPVETDCPLDLITRASEPSNEYARAWRDRVRAYHARRNQKFNAGSRVRIGDKTFEVLGPYRRRYRVRRECDGSVFAARPEQMIPV